MFRNVTIREIGGLNENEDPTSLKPNELTEAENTARLGVLTGTRPGFNYDPTGEYDALISGGPEVQGISEWTINRDVNRNVVTVAGGEARVGPAGGDILSKATNSVQITSGANNLWTFADHNNILYAAGGAAGDHFWYWDGTNPIQRILVLNSSAANIRPKYVFHWKNYLFLSGLQPVAASLPDDNALVWRFHNLGTSPTVAANWPTANTIGGAGIGGIPGYGTEFSTGASQFEDNNGAYLLLLSNKRIYSYVADPNALIGFVKNDEIANGCVSQHAYVDLGMDSGDAIYMSELGIHSLRLSQQYSGRARAFLSWPIRDTFAQLNRSRFQYVSAAYWPNEGIVTFLVSTGSNSTHDTLLAMDIQSADEITPETVRWYKWTLANIPAVFTDKMNIVVSGRDSDNIPVIYLGTTGGRVGVSNRDSYLDFTYQYETAFATKHEDFGVLGSTKKLGDLHLVSRGNGDYQPTHTYTFDYGARTAAAAQRLSFPNEGGNWSNDAGTTTSPFILGVTALAGEQAISRQKFYGVGSGETISHRFRHNPGTSSNEPFFIATITQQVSVTGEASPGEEAA